MARKDPQTRETYLNRLAHAIQRVSHRHSQFNFPFPKLITSAQSELSQPDTMDEFLPQGLELADGLISAYCFPYGGSNPTRSMAIEAVKDRLDAAQRLGRIVGAEGLIAAVDAIAGSSETDDEKALKDHAFRIAFDPAESAAMPQGVRLRCIGTFAITMDDPARRATAYATTLEMLKDPNIDAFDRLHAARRIYDHVTNYWRADWFAWINNPENKEKANQLGALIPGILDAMLQTDAPKAVKLMRHLSFEEYSGDRGSKDPMAFFLDPVLKQVAEIMSMKYDGPLDYSTLPKTLVLPRVIPARHAVPA